MAIFSVDSPEMSPETDLQTLKFLNLTILYPGRRDPDLPFFIFGVKRKENRQKTRVFFFPSEPSKPLGKEGKNAKKKNQGIPCKRKKTRTSPKTKKIREKKIRGRRIQVLHISFCPSPRSPVLPISNREERMFFVL